MDFFIECMNSQNTKKLASKSHAIVSLPAVSSVIYSRYLMNQVKEKLQGKSEILTFNTPPMATSQ